MKIVTAFEINSWKRVVYARTNTERKAERVLKELTEDGRYLFPRIENDPDEKRE